MVYAFSEEDYREEVDIMKNNRAVGRDDVLVDQLSMAEYGGIDS